MDKFAIVHGVVLACIVCLYLQNSGLTQEVRDMKEHVSNMTSSWETNAEGVEKQVRELQILAGSLKAQAEQFQALKKSVEDAIFQNKLHSLEIKDLKDTASEITSLRKTAVTLEMATQKGTLRLQDLEDKTRKTEQESQTTAASLRAHRDEAHTLKRSVEDAVLQTKRQAMDIQSVKQASSDIPSLGKAVGALDVLTTKLDRRSQDVDDKVKRMEQNLDRLSRNDQEFRDQIRKFRDQVDEYQRHLNNRNPLWDTLSGILDFFLSPLRAAGRKLIA